MILNKFCHIVYSHSSYSDLWPIYFGQTKKYFDNCPNKIIFLDKKSDLLPKNYIQVLYKDKDTYVKRLISCFKQLKKMGFEYCLFEHEDMFLYDFLKLDKIEKYSKAISKNYFDYIRLIKAGDFIAEESIIDETLFEFDLKSAWIFSVQPSLWNIDIFLKLLKNHKKDNIWTLEERAQKTCRKMKIKAGFSHQGNKKAGSLHFDNEVYPYVATAIVKGKWNIKEYPLLENLLKDYGIDKNIRGEVV